MTTTFIILAHPEPASFNGAWANASRKAALNAGHDVVFSDLCSLGFNAVEGQSHYPEHQPFDPLKAQESANQPPHDIADEIAKLEAADNVIFHFPIWWFAPPAVLKGWFDRVLMHGRIHTIDERFDRGKFRGKRVLFCVSAGAKATECGPDGKEGDIRMVLWPAAQTMRYLGFDVLEPRIQFGVHGYHEGLDKADLDTRLGKTLADQTKLLSNFDTQPLWPFNSERDFDEAGRLKPQAPSHSPFIRHVP